MSVKEYVLDNLFEFVLVTVCAACLCMNIGDAFNIAYETLFNLPLVLGAVLPVLLVCYFGAYRRRNVPIAIVACLVLMAVVVWIGSVTSVAGTFLTQSLGVTAILNDAEGNNLIYGFILAFVPPVTFLLSRRRGLCAILMVLGIFTCGLIQWLYHEWLWAQFALFMVAGSALFVYRTYRAQNTQAAAYKTSHDIASKRLTSAFAACLVPALLLGVSFIVWAGVIAPLNPPAQELKLVQMNYLPEIDENTSYDKALPDAIDNSETSDEVDKDVEQSTEEQFPNQNSDGSVNYLLKGLVDQYLALNYGMSPLIIVLIVLLVIGLIVGIIMFRKYLRKRWYNSLEGHSQAFRICAIYDRITRSLEHMAYAKPPSATQVEFATNNASALAMFEDDTGGVSYKQLSEIYERVYYGHDQPTDDDVDAFEAFWKPFFNNARNFSGPIRWLYRFWRI